MYLAWDGLAACLSWSVLFAFRKLVVEPRTFGIDIDATPDANFWKAIVLIPLFWWTVHALMGMYVNIRSRHRGLEVRQVVRASAMGGVLLFFALLLDDVTRTHVDHYETLAVWMSAHAGLTLLGRWMLTSSVVRRVQSGRWAFATILVGTEEDNTRFATDLQETPGRQGWNVLAQMTEGQIESDLGKLGRWLDEHALDRAVITTSVAKRESMLGWVAVLEGKGVELLVVPGALDYMAGTVRSTNLFGVPLVNLSRPGLGHGMKAVKRFVDMVVSIVALTVLSPLFLWVAWRVKRDSEGPVFYTQERLGLHGTPFRIVKFRTMFVDSEGGTPQLSSDQDSRITAVGKRLRQTRVDELPQFWNVLKGDMSLVGPRPERAFFAEQIVQHSPHFLRLQQVRPGITSWGQVKYGYAENVDQMRQRLRYDIMYLENISLLLDLKILLFTVRTVIRREGK
jgi:exopolysaccharide biosynthesis polyprenyl glycosylphosphotransferase